MPGRTSTPTARARRLARAPPETRHDHDPRSPLLSRPGAVALAGVDADVAAHYGDPMREQRLLSEGLAVVDLSHRRVLTVTGPDRLSWLHSMTTQQLTGLRRARRGRRWC